MVQQQTDTSTLIRWWTQQIFIHHNRLVRSIIRRFFSLFFFPIFKSFLSFLKRENVSLCEAERPSSFKHFLRCARVLSLSRARLALNLFMDSTLLLFELVFLQGACDPDVSCTNTTHPAHIYIQEGKWRRYIVWPLLILYWSLF